MSSHFSYYQYATPYLEQRIYLINVIPDEDNVRQEKESVEIRNHVFEKLS